MRKFFLITAIAMYQTVAIYAQPITDDLPQITRCIALVNARVISAPGKAPVTSHIIIRDGLITHIGPTTSIPPDAYRIQADSFFVYPAFIDAFSSIGIKEAEREGESGPRGPGNRGQRPSVDEEGNPSLDDAGITPFVSMRSTFDPKEKSIADWRAQGFAVSHVVPKGKMIPGQGSIVVLSGKGADQMIWKENISMYGQWVGAGGSYPSTIIAIMAKWRELYQNSTQYISHQASFENATLVSRPLYNQAHIALVPVVKKEMPVFFRAPRVKDISRALTMQQDLGMKMVIADAEEAWYLKDQIKSLNIPLILSLDLPEDKSSKKEEKNEKPEEAKEGGEGKEPAPDTIQKDPEKEAFEKRRAESLKAHLGQAAVLTREGISFSFGTMNGKPGDFTKNIRTMMDNGLSFDKALSALTTTPARLLGVEKYCGTLDIGKMANVIVSTKPLFDKDATIKFMIVEGNLYEYEAKEKRKGGGKETAAAFGLIKGTWEYSIETPDQRRDGKFEFSGSGTDIKGTITGNDMTGGNSDLDAIVIDGNTVSFTFDFDMGGQMMTLEFDLKIDGESFEGSVTVGQFGTFPIKGHRTSKPNSP